MTISKTKINFRRLQLLVVIMKETYCQFVIMMLIITSYLKSIIKAKVFPDRCGRGITRVTASITST